MNMDRRREGQIQIKTRRSESATDTAACSLGNALTLVAEGRPCFPCGLGKRPTSPHGFLNASTDPVALRKLWEKYPGQLVGIRTGDASGIDVLDLDRQHPEALHWWTVHRNRLPLTRTHRTRSGGLHLLFQHRLGLRCSIGRIVPGVDIRADAGYVIWWPAAGLPVLSDGPLAPWPKWLCAQLEMPRRPVTPRFTVPDPHLLARLVRRIAVAREGERNNLTFWAACRAGEMVASGLVEAEVAAAVIAEAAMRAGLPRAEAERTARSGIQTGGAYVK
jgi:hypothetical protein